MTATFRFVSGITLLLSVLFFFQGPLEAFESPKAAMIRVLGMACLAAAAAGWLAARLGGAARTERSAGRDDSRSRAARALDLVVVGWFAIELLCTLLSRSPVRSLIGEPLQREGLLTSLGLAGLYVASRRGLSSARDVHRWSAAWLSAVALACVYALFQVRGIDPGAWDPGASLAGGTIGRPFATLGHPNLLGVLTAVAGAIAAVGLGHGGRVRWISAAALALCATVTALTFSRAAWLAIALGVFAALWLAAIARREWRGSLLPLALASAVAIALLFAVMPREWGSQFGQRAAEVTAPHEGSAGGRIEIWRTAINAWRARPWIGQGPDAFGVVFPQYQTREFWKIEWGSRSIHAHSVFLHTLVTRGVAGAAVALAWLVIALASLRMLGAGDRSDRVRAACFASALLASGVAGGFGALGIGGAALLFFGTAALATQLESRPVEASEDAARGAHGGGRPRPVRSPRAQDSPAWAKTACVAAGVLVGALAGWREWNTLQASSRALESTAWQSVNLRESLRATLEAAALDPLEDRYLRDASEAWRRIANRDDDRAARVRATELARQAVRLEPLNTLNHRALAASLLDRSLAGEDSLWSAAGRAFERSLALAPNDATLLLDIARARFARGEPGPGLDLTARAIALYPKFAPAHWLAAVALGRLGNASAARSELELAIHGDWQGQDAARLEAIALAARLDAARKSVSGAAPADAAKRPPQAGPN